MLSSADDKAAEALKRQDIFFFIIKAHWIIFALFFHQGLSSAFVIP